MHRLALAFVLLLAGAPAADGPPSTESTDFIRFVETESEDSLQTALVRYQRNDGVQVDLVGAVHVADRAYFDELNRRFTAYDVVLYELVGGPHPGKKELRAGAADERLAWLGRLQETLRRSLELEGQLDCIDYGAANFLHADLSTEAFFESQQEHQETFLGLWLKALQAQKAAAGDRPQPGLAALLRILFSGDSATEMKRLIGREFDGLEPVLAGVEAGGGTTLVGERNRHALEVMQREVANGRRRLAIFYGAAHLPDLEKRLLALGFRRERIDYLKAWHLPARKS
jgi:hypothetical protein